MSNDRSEQELWAGASELIARLESRLQSALMDGLFESTAADLMESIPGIVCVRLSYVGAEASECLGIAGEFRPDPAEFQQRALVTESGALLIEVWCSSGADSSVRWQVIGETTSALAGLLSGAVARVRLQRAESEGDVLAERAAALRRCGDWKQQFHNIAVELAAALGIERLSVLLRRGDRFELVGSSIQLAFDARSQRVLQTQTVAGLIANRIDLDSLTTFDKQTELAADVLGFCDQVGADQLVAVAFDKGAMLAIGEVTASSASSSAWRELSLPETLLFENALADAAVRHPRWPAQGIRERLLTSTNRRVMVVAAVALLIGLFFPLTIKVGVDGRVVPKTQHVVYAPVAGQIERLDCEPGQRVRAGDPLCEFSSHQLELELTRLTGEVLEVQEQVEIAATRRSDQTAQGIASQGIASDRRVLEVRLAGLQQQIQVLREYQASLVMRSPIDGIVSLVIPADLGTIVMPRPIEMGQSVIRVVNPQDGYLVEFDIPDREVGYVIDALNDQVESGVHCGFRIRSEPDVRHAGVLTRLDQTARIDHLGRLVVCGVVQPVDRSQGIEGAQDFAVDSGVTGWVHCNRAAAGFVLCRKLIEQLRLWGW